MKYLIMIIFAAGVMVGSAYYVSRTGSPQTRSNSTAAKGAVQPAPSSETSVGGAAGSAPEKSAAQVEEPKTDSTRPAASAETPAPDLAMIRQAVGVLLSPDAAYDQKRAVWKQLRDSGGLDEAINQLEQRLAANPASADSAAVLGHAYLQKCAAISDLREQGILALQADKLFDTALSLDPQNWEARFTKAVALSYWPSSMGKSDEVIQQFQTLIQQQEALPQQPQFAGSYSWLGDQYKKLGRIDDARSTWARGAMLFPADQTLGGRLTSTP